MTRKEILDLCGFMGWMVETDDNTEELRRLYTFAPTIEKMIRLRATRNLPELGTFALTSAMICTGDSEETIVFRIRKAMADMAHGLMSDAMKGRPE